MKAYSDPDQFLYRILCRNALTTARVVRRVVLAKERGCMRALRQRIGDPIRFRALSISIASSGSRLPGQFGQRMRRLWSRLVRAPLRMDENGIHETMRMFEDAFALSRVEASQIPMYEDALKKIVAYASRRRPEPGMSLGTLPTPPEQNPSHSIWED